MLSCNAGKAFGGIIVSAETAILRTKPQMLFAVLEDASDTVVTEAVWILFIVSEFFNLSVFRIISDCSSVVSRKPDVSVLVF